MKKNNIRFTRKVFNTGEFHSEQVAMTAFPSVSPSAFLDIASYGYSFFKRGGRFPIVSNTWVFQLQTEGFAAVRSEGENFRVTPGDLLLIPPNVKYEYVIPKNSDMRKEFMILRSGPLPEFLFGNEVRNHGILIRNGDPAIATLYQKIGLLMKDLSGDSLEDLSVELYRLCYKIRQLILGRSASGNFEANLRGAANDLGGKISLEALSVKFGMGKYSLIRAFHKETGQSPVKYMISLRLKHAEQLLALSTLSIAEIAAACGYSSPSFFTYEFKKHSGITPRQFRAQSHSR